MFLKCLSIVNFAQVLLIANVLSNAHNNDNMKKCHSPKNTKPTKENENEYLKKLIADDLHWKQDKYK